MNKKDLGKVRKTLMDKRSDLLRMMRDKKQLDLQDVEIGDEIDSATQNIDKEILFELTDNEKAVLDAIDAALVKIDKGTYGLCDNCRSKIAEPRLNAIPWVRNCISCQAKAEKSSR
jgi:DnaK suppressor protein